MEGKKITLRRHGHDAVVDLDNFATLELLRDYIREAFQLDQEEAIVVTDVDRNEVTEDLYEDIQSGAPWRDNSSRSRIFLVFKAINERQAPVEDKISYQPHFNTLTKTGEAHFSKLSHALAEFIDNSIQARNDLSVEIELEPRGKGTSQLVISDNGVGMDAVRLKEFATYFLTQRARGNVPRDEDLEAELGTLPGRRRAKGKAGGRGSGSRGVRQRWGTFLSKFGVGALQAGFYVGSQLKV
ncbi:unnamed protein product, partial [Discosporangium mesarthrocarpum]